MSKPSQSSVGDDATQVVSAEKKKGLKLNIDVNKYLLLSLYCVVVVLRGATYFGWNGIQEMLYKSGAYVWDCTDPETNTTIHIGEVTYLDCPLRKQRIGGIFTVALASNLILSAFAGIVLDTLGPKITMICGIILDSIGWLLLGFSGVSFEAYYGAAFCIGASMDTGYLPLVSISNLFPKNSSFIIAVLGSLRSISFAVPVVMSVIFQTSAFGPDDLWRMCAGYVGVGQGICLAVTIFFVPMTAFVAPRTAAVEPEAAEKAQDVAEPTPQKEEDTRSFFRLLIDPKFLLLLPIFAAALIRSDYYAKSNKEQLTELSTERNLHEMFSIFNILSFIPGPFFGRLVDMYGIVVVLVILNTAGVLMFVFLMFDAIACKGISIIFYFLYTSFVLSNVYCYISINFPGRVFGKLAGFASMFAGLVALTSLLWYKWMLDFEFPTNFLVTNGIMVGLGIAVYLVIFALWKLDNKGKPASAAVDNQKTGVGETPDTTSVAV